MNRYLFSKFIALLSGICLIFIAIGHNKDTLYEINGNAYGTTWSVKSSEYISDEHYNKIKLIIKNIDFIASNYKENSEIGIININNPTEQVISDDLYEILSIAKEVELISEGFYNIMLGKVSSNLGFSPNFGKTLNQESASNYELKNNLLIKNSSNWFDLSSIAKGYAVQKIHEYLIENNFFNHLIDIGGELIAYGKNNENPWNVGIQNPNTINESPVLILSNDILNFMAIATSGEYRNFLISNDGQKITHSINPKTLKSVKNNLLSVTVVHENSSTHADALATAFNVMGKDKALSVANNNNLAIMLITDSNEIYFSNKWYDLKL